MQFVFRGIWPKAVFDCCNTLPHCCAWINAVILVSRSSVRTHFVRKRIGRILRLLIPAIRLKPGDNHVDAPPPVTFRNSALWSQILFVRSR